MKVNENLSENENMNENERKQYRQKRKGYLFGYFVRTTLVLYINLYLSTDFGTTETTKSLPTGTTWLTSSHNLASWRVPQSNKNNKRMKQE